MSISKEDVKNVAHLARIHMAESELEQYTQTLSKILDFIDHISQYDTDNVEPLAHPLDVNARLRDDVADTRVDRDTLQALAPATADGLYCVPEVIEK